MSSFRPADPLNPLDRTAATAFTNFYDILGSPTR